MILRPSLICIALMAGQPVLANCVGLDPTWDIDQTLAHCAPLAENTTLPVADRVEAMLRLATALRLSGQDMESDGVFANAAALAGTDAALHLRLSAAHLALHDSEPALDHAQTALALDPAGGGHLALCRIRSFDLDYRAALPDCEAALALAPDDPQARLALAAALNRLLMAERALAIALPGLDRPDAPADLFLEAADAAATLGRTAENRALMARGLARFPEDPQFRP